MRTPKRLVAVLHTEQHGPPRNGYIFPAGRWEVKTLRAARWYEHIGFAVSDFLHRLGLKRSKLRSAIPEKLSGLSVGVHISPEQYALLMNTGIHTMDALDRAGTLTCSLVPPPQYGFDAEEVAV